MTDEAPPPGHRSRFSENPLFVAASRWFSIFGPTLVMATLMAGGWVAGRYVDQQDKLIADVEKLFVTQQLDEAAVQSLRGQIATTDAAQDHRLDDHQHEIDATAAHVDAQDKLISTHDSRIRCLERGLKGGCPQ